MAELSQERRKLAVLQKRVNDPEYDAEVKRKAAEKKINQRRRQKSGFRENQLVSDVYNPNKNIKQEIEGEVDNEVDNEVQENQENIFTTPSPRRTSLRERRRQNTEELEDLEDQENIFRSPSPRSSSQKEKGEQLKKEKQTRKKQRNR